MLAIAELVRKAALARPVRAKLRAYPPVQVISDFGEMRRNDQALSLEGLRQPCVCVGSLVIADGRELGSQESSEIGVRVTVGKLYPQAT